MTLYRAPPGREHYRGRVRRDAERSTGRVVNELFGIPLDTLLVDPRGRRSASRSAILARARDPQPRARPARRPQLRPPPRADRAHRPRADARHDDRRGGARHRRHDEPHRSARPRSPRSARPTRSSRRRAPSTTSPASSATASGVGWLPDESVADEIAVERSGPELADGVLTVVVDNVALQAPAHAARASRASMLFARRPRHDGRASRPIDGLGRRDASRSPTCARGEAYLNARRRRRARRARRATRSIVYAGRQAGAA